MSAVRCTWKTSCSKPTYLKQRNQNNYMYSKPKATKYWIWEYCGKIYNRKLSVTVFLCRYFNDNIYQEIHSIFWESREGRSVTGAKYYINSTDLLNRLFWDTLEDKRFCAKSVHQRKEIVQSITYEVQYSRPVTPQVRARIS